MSIRQSIWGRMLALALLATVPLFLISCGSNVFEGINGGSSRSSLEESTHLIENAESVEDYQEALSAADQALADDSISNAERQQALENRGKALIGQNGISTSGLVSIVQGDDEDEAGESDNIADVIGEYVEDADQDDILDAAESMNEAADLGELDDSTEIVRGTYNSMAAFALVTEDIEIDEENDEISFKNGKSEDDIVDIFDAMMDPDGDGDVSNDGLVYHVDELDEAFGNVDNMSDDVTEDIDELGQAVDDPDSDADLRGLHAAMNGANGGQFTFEGVTYDVGVGAANRNANITDAIGEVLGTSIQ